MINFDDTQKAFAHKGRLDLYNAILLFGSFKYSWVIEFLEWVTSLIVKYNLPVKWIIKFTLFRQFVGGEGIDDCGKVVSNLDKYNVKGVLDYSAESGVGDEDIKISYSETVKTIENAATDKRIAFAVFKPSALHNLLTDAEGDRLKEMVLSLCSLAKERSVKILIDAEHYSNQGLYDSIAEEAMRKFNKEEAVVYHTLQMYRRDRPEYLKRLYEDSVKEGYVAGIKLVRGAYMESEREEAASKGYDSPIFDTKEECDIAYDDALTFMVDNIDKFAIFCGTHNYKSNLHLINLMAKNGIKRGDSRVYFSQLLGMSDNISFSLAFDGYNVCKYIPYAPVKSVLPYLMRRAKENSSVKGQSSRELELLKREIRRRGVI